MPLKLSLTLGANTFAVEGDFAFDEGFATVLRSWVNAQQPDGDGAHLEAITDRLRLANDAQAQAVLDNTQPPTPPQGEPNAS